MKPSEAIIVRSITGGYTLRITSYDACNQANYARYEFKSMSDALQSVHILKNLSHYKNVIPINKGK